MNLEDIWDQDKYFDRRTTPPIPVPAGFRLFSDNEVGWRNRVGDKQRQSLSLSALSHDISGLAALPVTALWRLEIRHRKVTDDDFDLVTRFDGLEELDATRTKLTDTAMRALHTLQKLRVLHVAHCAITDAAMEHIASLRKLEHLDVCATQVSDDGLRALAFHPALRTLNLRGTRVTGERLAPLVTIEPLRQLSLSSKQAKHARRFSAERPDVEILY